MEMIERNVTHDTIETHRESIGIAMEDCFDAMSAIDIEVRTAGMKVSKYLFDESVSDDLVALYLYGAKTSVNDTIAALQALADSIEDFEKEFHEVNNAE